MSNVTMVLFVISGIGILAAVFGAGGIAAGWIHARRGYHWVADRWDSRGTYWYHVPGHWER